MTQYVHPLHYLLVCSFTHNGQELVQCINCKLSYYYVLKLQYYYMNNIVILYHPLSLSCSFSILGSLITAICVDNELLLYYSVVLLATNINM